MILATSSLPVDVGRPVGAWLIIPDGLVAHPVDQDEGPHRRAVVNTSYGTGLFLASTERSFSGFAGRVFEAVDVAPGA